MKHFGFHQRGKRRIHDSPGVTHLKACRPWVLAELTVMDPVGVVALGATAVRSLLGTGVKVTQDRGTLLPWPDDLDVGASTPQWAMATIHPSAVLRSDDLDAAYAGFVTDLRVAATFLG